MSGESDKVYVPAAKVRERYGGISDMSLWRWVRNPEMGFPQPLTINRRRYWCLRELEVWEQFRATNDEAA